VARRQAADPQVDPPALRAERRVGGAGADERVHVDVDLVERLAAEMGEGKQVVDKEPHSLRGTPDRCEEALAFRRQLGAKVLDHHLGKAVDRPQGGPQVVGNRIGESLELPVRGLELRRSLGHALFELEVDLEVQLLGALSLGDVRADGDVLAGLAAFS